MTTPPDLAMVIEPGKVTITRPGGLTKLDLRIAEHIYQALVDAGKLVPGGAG